MLRNVPFVRVLLRQSNRNFYSIPYAINYNMREVIILLYTKNNQKLMDAFQSSCEHTSITQRIRTTTMSLLDCETITT
jgi:hypothetical protein